MQNDFIENSEKKFLRTITLNNKRKNSKYYMSEFRDSLYTLNSAIDTIETSNQKKPVMVPILTEENISTLPSVKSFKNLNIRKHFGLLFLPKSKETNKNLTLNLNNNLKRNKESNWNNNKTIVTSTIISNKLKEKKKDNKINLLDFGPELKLYCNESSKIDRKKLLELREQRKFELYYDYDNSNNRVKKNSFSGNGADLLKSKILFVKGCIDYLYPRMVITKSQFLKDIKAKQFKNLKVKIEKYKKNKDIYSLKHLREDERVKLSKFKYNGIYCDEFINQNTKWSKTPKVIVNKHKVSRLSSNFNFM